MTDDISITETLKGIFAAIDPDIEEGKGFSESDTFGLKTHADKLTQIICALPDKNNVILIDGAWGTGKSVFVKQWRDTLKNDYEAIYIDAFSVDYISDPFVLITSRLIAEKIVDDSGGKIKEAAKNLAISFSTNAIKSATAGTIDLDSLSKIIDDEFSEDKNSIKKTEEFKTALAKTTETLEKRIIIIIDELDRCRPDFALKILEKVKHLFGIPNVSFVIVADRQRLADMVKHEYGFDSEHAIHYLSKFFAIATALPIYDINDSQFNSGYVFLRNLRTKLYGKFGENEKLSELERLCLFLKLSIRDVQRILQRFILVKLFEDISYPDEIWLGLCVIQLHNPDLFEKIKSGTVTWEEIKKMLGLSEHAIYATNDPKKFVSLVWALLFPGKFTDGRIREIINDYEVRFGINADKSARDKMRLEIITKFEEHTFIRTSE